MLLFHGRAFDDAKVCQASNINDEPFHAYFADERFLSQFEEYDYTGVRFTY